MIVCVCHRVSDRDIAREAAAGASFDDLQVDLGVGTRCGACLDCARDVHRRHVCGPAAAGTARHAGRLVGTSASASATAVVVAA
jgi:bacterioferritin-associated ferredoxin